MHPKKKQGPLCILLITLEIFWLDEEKEIVSQRGSPRKLHAKKNYFVAKSGILLRYENLTNEGPETENYS